MRCRPINRPCPPALFYALILALALASCSPSVRYTRDQPRTASATPADNIADTAATERQQQPPNKQPNTRGQANKGSQRLLEQIIASYLGTPYKYGGMSRSGVDCSGFVSLVYREAYGKTLPRSSRKMWDAGRPVPISAAKPGDLVFFKGGTFSTIDHVGIYMGNNKFAHSSTSKGVIYSNLNETYYARRFAGVKRM